MNRTSPQRRAGDLAEQLVLDVYRATRGLPAEEAAGLQAQVRKAALAVPTHLVKGSAKGSPREQARSLGAAVAATSETRLLLKLAVKLELLQPEAAEAIELRCGQLIRGLVLSLDALQASEAGRAPRRRRERVATQAGFFSDPAEERGSGDEEPAG